MSAAAAAVDSDAGGHSTSGGCSTTTSSSIASSTTTAFAATTVISATTPTRSTCLRDRDSLPVEIWALIVGFAAQTLGELERLSRLTHGVRAQSWLSLGFRADFVRRCYRPGAAVVHQLMDLPQFAQVLERLGTVGYVSPDATPDLARWLVEKNPPADDVAAAVLPGLLERGYSVDESRLFYAIMTHQNRVFRELVQLGGENLQMPLLLFGCACFHGNTFVVECLSATYNPLHPLRDTHALAVPAMLSDPNPVLQYCGPGADGRTVVPASVADPTRPRRPTNSAIVHFHMAARNGHLALVRYLHEQHLHFPINASGIDDTTPLMYAAAHGRADVAEYLLAHGADVGARDEAGWTALYHAVKGDDAAAAAPPFFRRAREGRLRVVELLLRAGADPDARSTAGWTPLHELCFRPPEDSDLVDIDFLALLLGMEEVPESDNGGPAGGSGSDGGSGSGDEDNVSAPARQPVYDPRRARPLRPPRWRSRADRSAASRADPNALTSLDAGSLFYTAVGDSSDPLAGLLDAGADASHNGGPAGESGSDGGGGSGDEDNVAVPARQPVYDPRRARLLRPRRWRPRADRSAASRADPNALTSLEAGSLFYTAVGDSGDPLAGLLLLDAGADASLPLNDRAMLPERPGFTALHQAVRRVHPAAVGLLAADPVLFAATFVADLAGNTPLHLAAARLTDPSAAAVAATLERGAGSANDVREHWRIILGHLLGRCRPADADAPNAAGVTPNQLAGGNVWSLLQQQEQQEQQQLLQAAEDPEAGDDW
ncbi:hypothetical protein HK405_004794 [Cladochytrium tenue]|nr:hypothetical protein HK405_004794 [Cladochytrium tenue]